MPDLAKQTPRQRAQMTYMMDVMRSLEWDLHNTIELTGRIPEEWHEIASRPPAPALQKVTLRLDKDVLAFFRRMGTDYGPRINDVLRSYMYARLTGLLRGAETVNHFRVREELHSGPKPAFEGEDPAAWRGNPGLMRARQQEGMQRQYAADGLPEDLPPGQRVR